MDVFDRRNYVRYVNDPTRPRGVVQRESVSNMEIWCECFGKDRNNIKRTDSYEIEAILKKIGGWERTTETKTGKTSFKLYGPQKTFVRHKQ